jgi:hypothetical protein
LLLIVSPLCQICGRYTLLVRIPRSLASHILYQDRVLFRLHILCDGQSTTILPSVTIVAILVSYTLAAAITTTDNEIPYPHIRTLVINT